MLSPEIHKLVRGLWKYHHDTRSYRSLLLHVQWNVDIKINYSSKDKALKKTDPMFFLYVCNNDVNKRSNSGLVVNSWLFIT